ncbi:alpha/beta fold hydrolase [Reinekea thalattae]|uniref:Lysophospholipase n=1 Tax=Reinekea thalattae TaxID=2593301 RepID=A0A5C8ZAB5_9GAMM|nr:alpha/beta fold hydrolase [Reinekea thalattae]TXR54717.1 lysophospholipase [Reinekea thalattae]
MQYLEEFIQAKDGHDIPVRLWRPNRVERLLVIVHGMAEYCERYAAFADWLTESNIAVVTLNLRGHGMDCNDDELGYFGEKDGWQLLLADIHATIEFAKQELPNVPITLFGHSMGSFLAQNYIQQYPQQCEQLILGSTNRVNRSQISSALFLVSLLKRVKGSRAHSSLVEWLVFGRFNRRFKPNMSDNDWLSRDAEQVEAYTLDPFCGFPCSLSMWQDLFNGMLSIDIKNWPSECKLHLLSGSDDALGEFGQGITILANNIKKQALRLTTFRLYQEARHELLNETNAMQVWQDIRDITLTGKLKEV